MELATSKQISYINHLAGDSSYTSGASLQKGQASSIIERLLSPDSAVNRPAPADNLKNSREWNMVSIMASKGKHIDTVMSQREHSNPERFDAAIAHFYK